MFCLACAGHSKNCMHSSAAAVLDAHAKVQRSHRRLWTLGFRQVAKLTLIVNQNSF